MRRRCGILFIVLSLFIALGGLLTIQEDFKASIIGIVVFSMPLYVLGQIVRTNIRKVKENGFRWMWAYLYVVIIVPALFLSYEGYEALKEQTFSNNDFLLFESMATDHIGGLSIGFIMLLLLLFAFPFYEDISIKAKRGIGMAAVLVTAIYAGYQYMTWSDYRGVHEVNGLVSHYWNGEEQIIPFEHVERIVVQPYVKYAALSDPTDDTYFAWRLIFMTKEKEQITYRMWLNEISIAKGNRMKQLAHAKGIPFQTLPLTDKQHDEFDFQLELQELDKEPYYSFFEVD